MTELIINKPLYSKIDMANLSKTEILDILFCKESIECFCPSCKKPSVFVKVPNREQGQREKALSENSIFPHVEENLFEVPEVFNLDFSCSINNKHTLNVIYKVENKVITKIGQSPSLFDIQKNEFKKYRNILENNYSDLSNAIMFYNSGFGVAAFTHFRRIIENYFVKKAYEIKKVQSDWDDKNYKESRFLEKLELLKDVLPKTLLDNPRLYSIVSKGIHELKEDDCLLYFEAVKECIFLSLDEIIDEEKKRKSQSKLKSELSRIENRISKK